MYFSTETIINVIDRFKQDNWTDKKHKMEYFFLFLLLKRMGASPKTKISSEVFSSEISKNVLKNLIGIFSPEEKPLKACSISPFAFNNNRIEQNKYFNQGTPWKDLTGRIPDTLDNTIRDYFVERTQDVNTSNRLFYLKQNYLEILKGKSFLDDKKINIYQLAIWVYRFTNFSSDFTSNSAFLRYLRDLFYEDFNIVEEEKKILFKEEEINISFSEDRVLGSSIRSRLPISVAPTFEENDQLTLNHVVEPPNLTYTQYEINRRNRMISEKRIYELLKDKYQAILYGPPGTGKSYIANKLKEYKEENENVFDSNNIRIIQFHPSYSYENFIGGVKWDALKNKPIIDKGDLLKICIEAKKYPSKQYLFIIDEINRGNLSNIFGETIMVLDRDYKVNLPNYLSVDEEKGLFYIPKNVYILGTMNSSDRSIGSIDYAIRRRFAFVRMDFDKKNLEEYYNTSGYSPEIENGTEVINIIDFAERLNNNIQKILGPDLVLGQSYYMAPKGKWQLEGFLKHYNYSIFPIIEEYCFNKKDKMNEILKNLNKKFDDPYEFFIELNTYIQDVS